MAAVSLVMNVIRFLQFFEWGLSAQVLSRGGGGSSAMTNPIRCRGSAMNCMKSLETGPKATSSGIMTAAQTRSHMSKMALQDAASFWQQLSQGWVVASALNTCVVVDSATTLKSTINGKIR